MIHLRIISEGQTVVDFPEWDAPVPQVGDHIFHPPFSGDKVPPSTAGCVKTVTWRTHDRVRDDMSWKYVQKEHPYVELYI